MDKLISDFRQRIQRSAIVMDLGGFRPSDDPLSSWFGKVLMAQPGELWPEQDGKPMLPLAQINLSELPYQPEGLEDIRFITVFIGPDQLPVDEPNGKRWQLRAYSSLSELVPLEQPETQCLIKPFPLRAREVTEDFPCWEGLPVDCPDELDDDYFDLFENVNGFKFGGWPSLIQGGLSWGYPGQDQQEPEYIFQIDTTEKGNWMWGDHGVGYFGLKKKGQEREWFLDWQCF